MLNIINLRESAYKKVDSLKFMMLSLAGVPMVIGGTSSQTAKMTIGATLDWESDSFSPDVFIKEFEFKPLDIRLYVGPGISKNVKAVVYGQGGVKGKIIPDSTYLGLYGDLECGVSVKFFFIEADQPYKSEKDILIWEKYLDRENTGRTRTTLFYRFAAKEGYDVTVKTDISKYVGYSDVGDYALDAMKWAVGIGLISGIEYNQDGVTIRDLAPKSSATRAQLATILMRFCNYYHI